MFICNFNSHTAVGVVPLLNAWWCSDGYLGLTKIIDPVIMTGPIILGQVLLRNYLTVM